MAEADVLSVLEQHWPATLPYLTGEDRAFLAERVAVMDGGGPAARRALAEIAYRLAERLPASHPVQMALASGTRLVAAPADVAQPDAAAAELARAGALLRRLPGLTSVVARPPGAEQGDPHARLLAAQSLTEQQVRDGGADPARPDLIRLRRRDRRIVLPAFQFGPDGRPVLVVTQVNALLEAAEDPWGVADWWLGRNAWLDGAPADLLGRVPDADLMLAARAELPED